MEQIITNYVRGIPNKIGVKNVDNSKDFSNLSRHFTFQARVEARSEPLVLVAFVQHSSVLSRTRAEGTSGTAGAGDTAEAGVTGESRSAWHRPGLGAQPHVSCCGHALHARCWRKYVDNVLDKEKLR